MCSIKAEEMESNAGATHILPEQLSWQLAQCSAVEGGAVKLEQDSEYSGTMSNWQVASEQPDTSYEETECSSGYDDSAVRNRNFMPNQRAGKRYNTSDILATRRKRQITGDTKLPDIFRFFCNIEKVHGCHAKPGAISATCNACQTRIKGFITVTSNFIKHLRLKHFEIHAAFISAKQAGNAEVPEVTAETDSFDSRVMWYVIDTAIPLSTVETVSFRNLFRGTTLRVLSRAKLQQRLNERFTKMCSSIKAMIHDRKYVCATADVWTTRQCSLFGYTCHWLDHKYQRKSVALSCQRFSGEQNQLLDMINRINREFDLNNLKIVANVTHNGTNFAKAFKEFGINDIKSSPTDAEYCAAVEEQDNLLPNHIKSASYTLNYIASTDFMQLLTKDKALKEKHLKVFEKCSSFWRKYKSAKTSETTGTAVNGDFFTPVATRWNSVYDAISDILSQKARLPEVCSRLALHNSCFSAGDIHYLKEYRVLMTPIVSTIEFLQLESNLLYGCLLPALTSLCVKLKRILDSGELIDLRHVAVDLLEKLKERFASYVGLSEEANSAIIASVLCPSVKMRWFNALTKVSTHRRSADDIHKIIITETVRHAKASENTYQYAMDYIFPKIKDDFYEFDEIDDACETSDLDTSQPSPLAPTSKLTEDVQSQFHNYLRDPGTNFEMLEKYPLLHDLAIKYNTPLTSSTPVEKLLSPVNIVKYLRNSDLCEYPFEKMVLLKANLNV